MQWAMDEVADSLERVFRQSEENLKLEQAVYGLDAMKETAVQDLLGRAINDDGFATAAREVHYPSDLGKKRPSRRRCDLVLTPPGRPLLQADEANLFTPTDACPAEQALWLELKLAHQFAEGGRNHGGYGQQWRQATVKDLQKMETETRVREAALMLLVFTAGADIAAKDLELFEDVLAMKQVLAGFRQTRQIEIVERNGHTHLTIALWPTVQRTEIPA